MNRDQLDDFLKLFGELNELPSTSRSTIPLDSRQSLTVAPNFNSSYVTSTNQVQNETRSLNSILEQNKSPDPSMLYQPSFPLGLKLDIDEEMINYVQSTLMNQRQRQEQLATNQEQNLSSSSQQHSIELEEPVPSKVQDKRDTRYTNKRKRNHNRSAKEEKKRENKKYVGSINAEGGRSWKIFSYYWTKPDK
jgi:hypothetical protein